MDGQCKYTLSGPNRHASAVTSLQFLENGLVATSSDDGSVKLWDVKQGMSVSLVKRAWNNNISLTLHEDIDQSELCID